MENLSLLLFNNAQLIQLIFVLLIFISVITFFFKPKKCLKNQEETLQKSTYFVQTSLPGKKLNAYDRYYMILLTGIYAIIVFFNLGNTKIPTTYWQPTIENQSIIFKADSLDYTKIGLIGGEGDNNNNASTYQIGMKDITLYGSHNLQNFELIEEIESSSYMRYQFVPVENSYEYIKIQINNLNDVINEIALIDANNQLIGLSIIEDMQSESEYPATLLIDEQDKFIANPSYEDESFFDEIYHVRNAVEVVNGQYMYASVHPLLGTNIIALFIQLLGNNPLGWRFGGALFGCLMIPIFYLLAKRLFRKERYASMATLLFCVDFMHLTTSRIATLEPFSIFFILLMFYFMSEYYYTSFIDTSLKKQFVLLGLCGLSMAAAWATKWTGCYSSAGLAILFFINYFKRIKELKIAKKKDLTKVYEDIHEQLLVDKVMTTYPKKLISTFLFCCLFFVIIPVIFYFGIHIIDKMWRDGYSITNMIDQILYTFNYHSKLDSTHPFQSNWYQWILNIRPIWYYIKRIGDTAMSISCFSNPMTTLGCFISLFYGTYALLKRKSDVLLIIFVGFLSALLPWMLVSRCVFAYHFYPSTPFYILCLVYMLKNFDQRFNTTKYTNLFVASCVFVFILFLPATCGFLTNISYLEGFLTWLPSWNFN